MTLRPSPWFVCPRPRPDSAMRLFCIPYAGVGGSVYRAWADRLPSSVEMLAVQLPGRENRLRERPYTDMPKLIAELAENIRPYLDKPFAIYGHSLGALVGFEWARAVMESGGIEPVHLFLGARHAPQLPEPAPPLHDLPEERFLIEIQRRYQGVPESVFNNPELRALFLPTLRADFRLLGNYTFQPGKRLSCPITAIGAVQDLTRRDHLEGWAEHTTGPFAVHMLPGGHFFLQGESSRLLQILAEALE